MEPRIIATAARVGNVIERLLAAFRPGRHGQTVRTLRIVPYRSVGNATSLTVCGRVVQEATTRHRRPRRTGAVPAREHLAAMYRAFDVAELSSARIAVWYDGQRIVAECDPLGFFSVDVPAPRGHCWRGGQHTAQVQLLAAASVSAALTVAATNAVTADVYVPGIRATLTIVSDLDDTAMDTNTLSMLSSIATVMFRSARRRRPVPGVPALYRALQAGPDGHAENPVCYISSGAWNLYDAVVDYLDTHDMPHGSILLNDWGSRRRGFHAVAHAHKALHVSQLLARLPTMPFLLIGDDVQEDPEIYFDVARAHPGRIAAIWIRQLRHSEKRRRSIDAMRALLAAVGTDLVIAADTADFVADAASRDWIQPTHGAPAAATR